MFMTTQSHADGDPENRPTQRESQKAADGCDAGSNPAGVICQQSIQKYVPPSLTNQPRSFNPPIAGITNYQLFMKYGSVRAL